MAEALQFQRENSLPTLHSRKAPNWLICQILPCWKQHRGAESNGSDAGQQKACSDEGAERSSKEDRCTLKGRASVGETRRVWSGALKRVQDLGVVHRPISLSDWERMVGKRRWLVVYSREENIKIFCNRRTLRRPNHIWSTATALSDSRLAK